MAPICSTATAGQQTPEPPAHRLQRLAGSRVPSSRRCSRPARRSPRTCGTVTMRRERDQVGCAHSSRWSCANLRHTCVLPDPPSPWITNLFCCRCVWSLPGSRQRACSSSQTSSRPVKAGLGFRGTSKCWLRKRDGGVSGSRKRSYVARCLLGGARNSKISYAYWHSCLCLQYAAGRYCWSSLLCGLVKEPESWNRSWSIRR